MYRTQSVMQRTPSLASFAIVRIALILSALVVLPSLASAQTNYGFKLAIGGNLNAPLGIATDAAGNFFIADSANNRVVKYDKNHSFVGKIGIKGTGTSQFTTPSAVAVDSLGNLYVADTGNNRIQKFDKSGVAIAPLGGFGGYGSTAGKLRSPLGIAVDGANNVYVADTGNNRIQKFDNVGNFVSQFGIKGTIDGQFNAPNGVAVDKVTGEIYVSDTGNNRVQKFNSSGTWQWTKTGYSGPQQIWVDSAESIYVAVYNQSYIAQLYADGSSAGPNIPVNNPIGVAVDNDGNLYTSNNYNQIIQKHDLQGNLLAQFGSSVGTSRSFNGQFNGTYGVAADSNSGSIYITDNSNANSRIQKFDKTGAFLWSKAINWPYGIAVNTAGNVFVSNTYNNVVQKFDTQGNALGNIGGNGTGNGQFSSPAGIAFDSTGNVYVSDYGNYRVQLFDGTGTFKALLGSQGTGNGMFNHPSGVALDSKGNIYVVDSGNNRVQMFDSSRNYVTQFGTLGSGNGQFNYPMGIAIDSKDNIYVADSNNSRVQVFNASRQYVTQFTADGAWGDDFVSQVTSVAVDTAGTVYVTDNTNSRIVVLAAVSTAPTLTSLSPTQVLIGSGDTTVTITGSDLIKGATAKFGTTVLPTTFTSSTQLTVLVPASLLATAAALNVTVTNPGIVTASNIKTFTVANPVPTIANVSPNQAPQNSLDVPITVTGTKFVPKAVIKFGTTALTTTYVSDTQLTATIPAASLTKIGLFNITVANPTPGGGTSNAVVFSVGSNLIPTVTSLSPSLKTAGSAAFTLTVNGTNFVSGATVKFDGVVLTTTYKSATQLTASVTAPQLVTARKLNVLVNNPKPGGGNSNSRTFTVANPAPALTAITPSEVAIGSAATTINLTGTGFVAGSVVQWNGVALVTTYKTATQLTAVIPVDKLTTAGDFDIAVMNPAPSGGTSTAVTFSVLYPTPTLTSMSPKVIGSGAPNTVVTLTGTNFVKGATVTFGTATLNTTFVSATQLTVTIPAAQLAAPGAFDVVVTNPAPGGGDSAAVTFTVLPSTTLSLITSPAPTVTKSGTVLTVTATIKNLGTADAQNVLITSAKLGTTAAATINPLTAVTITKSGTKVIILTFPTSAAASGTTPTLTLSYTSDNAGSGNFTGTTAKVP